MGFDEIPEQALDWVERGKNVALATVVQTWGSAPRHVGAMLAVTSDGDMCGSVSGGCVEGAVIEAAADAMLDGKPRLLEFGVSDDNAFSSGLACGGDIRVLVEPIGVGIGMDVAFLKDLVKTRARRDPVAYRVNIETWERKLSPPNPDLSDRFFNDKSGFDGDWFVSINNPPLRLMVIGAVHIAQPLLQMAKLAGYDVTLIDPRTAFASPQRFPDQTLVHDWPDVALKTAKLDVRTALVTLAHDPKIDDPAIAAALESSVFYLGCLGSTRTHAKRVARLTDAGFSAADLSKIHAPVGLDIGAKTPSEIAISIMAELTERLRRPNTRR